jgi:hypothetical protein
VGYSIASYAHCADAAIGTALADTVAKALMTRAATTARSMTTTTSADEREGMPPSRDFEVDYDENFNEKRIHERSPALPISDFDC